MPLARFFGSKFDPNESVTMGASGRENCFVIDFDWSRATLTFDVQRSCVLYRQRRGVVLLLDWHGACDDFAVVFGCRQINDIRCRDVAVGRCLWMQPIGKLLACEIDSDVS